MKKILISSTALAAVLVGSLVLIPGRAQATTAKEKFISMRSGLAQAAANGLFNISATLGANGATNIDVKLDGQPLPPDVPVNVVATDDGTAIDYTVTIDLSDGAFTQVAFGKDSNTLKLVPKAKPDHVDIVRLDPKTGSVLSWTCYSKDDKGLKPIGTVNYPVQTTSASTTPKPSDGLITSARIRNNKGGSATVTVQKNP